MSIKKQEKWQWIYFNLFYFYFLCAWYQGLIEVHAHLKGDMQQLVLVLKCYQDQTWIEQQWLPGLPWNGHNCNMFEVKICSSLTVGLW